MTATLASRRLIAIWMSLAILIATIVVVQRNDAPSTRFDEQSSASDVRWLLPAPIDQIGAIEVAHAGVIDRLERDGSGAWFYHGAHTGQQLHQADTATAQYIEHALAGFGRTQIERTLPIGGAGGVQLAEGTSSAGQTYGVTVPSLIVLVYAPGKTEPWVQYAVGDVTPDGYGRYLLRVGSSSVVTIANYQITNLLNLIAEVANPGMMAPKRDAHRDALAS